MDKKIALKQLNLLDKKGSKLRLAAEKWKNNWQTLTAIILSARTRDEKTISISKKLFEKYPSAKKLAGAKLISVKKIIKPVNFYKNKAKNIINSSKEILQNYNGKVPEEITELIKLPGVGRKTANVFLSEIGKDAIGVDTHVSYISQKLGWTKNKKPELIEQDLEDIFPKKSWSRINSILVRFGKTYINRKKKDKLLNEINRTK